MTERHRPSSALEHLPPAAVRPAMRDRADMGGIGCKAEREPNAAHDWLYAGCGITRSSSEPYALRGALDSRFPT